MPPSKRPTAKKTPPPAAAAARARAGAAEQKVTATPATHSRWPSVVSVCLVLCLLGAATVVVLRRNTSAPEPSAAAVQSMFVDHVSAMMQEASWRLPVRILTGSEKFADVVNAVVEAAEPVVLQGTVADKWKASVLWKNPEYIKEQLLAAGKKLTSVIVSPSPVLVYADESKLWKGAAGAGKKSEASNAAGGVPGFEGVEVPEHSKADLSPEEFWRMIEDHQDEKFGYLVANEGKGNLMDWMVKDVHPITGFKVKKHHKAGESPVLLCSFFVHSFYSLLFSSIPPARI